MIPGRNWEVLPVAMLSHDLKFANLTDVSALQLHAFRTVRSRASMK